MTTTNEGHMTGWWTFIARLSRDSASLDLNALDNATATVRWSSPDTARISQQ